MKDDEAPFAYSVPRAIVGHSWVGRGSGVMPDAVAFALAADCPRLSRAPRVVGRPERRGTGPFRAGYLAAIREAPRLCLGAMSGPPM